MKTEFVVLAIVGVVGIAGIFAMFLMQTPAHGSTTENMAGMALSVFEMQGLNGCHVSCADGTSCPPPGGTHCHCSRGSSPMATCASYD